jgi:hypothetical protein
MQHNCYHNVVILTSDKLPHICKKLYKYMNNIESEAGQAIYVMMYLYYFIENTRKALNGLFDFLLFDYIFNMN